MSTGETPNKPRLLFRAKSIDPPTNSPLLKRVRKKKITKNTVIEEKHMKQLSLQGDTKAPRYFFKGLSNDSENSSDIQSLNKTKVQPILVVGSKFCGKTEFISKLMNLDGITLDKEQTPDVDDDISVGILTNSLTNEDDLFTLIEINNYEDIGNYLESCIVSIIILHDFTQSSSLLYTRNLLKFIANYLRYSKISYIPNILLVLYKIDRFSSSNFNMEDIFNETYKLSIKYNTKFLPITTQMNKTNLILSLQISLFNYEYKSNQQYLCNINNIMLYNTMNYIISDNTISSIEDYLWVRKNKRNWNRRYCVVKGEFFIQQTSTDIIILFLTVCNTLLLHSSDTENESYFKIITPNENEYIFSTQCIEESNAWINACKSTVLPIKGDITPRHKVISQNITTISFSSILNISNSISCVDCKVRGCSFISLKFCTYLCRDCANIHTLYLSKNISKILALHEIRNYSYLWSALHTKTNKEFNILWEMNKSKKYKISYKSSLEDRINYITKKYKQRQFYGYPENELYVTTLLNTIEWSKKYLVLSHTGLLSIYKNKNTLITPEYSYHINYWYFEQGYKHGLSGEYFKLIGPDVKLIFRTKSEKKALLWLKIFHSTKLRLKYSQNIVKPSIKSKNISNTSIPKINHFSMVDVFSLLTHKQSLSKISILKEKQESIKEKLEKELQDTLNELQKLCKQESQLQLEIEKIEPDFIKDDIKEYNELISETVRRLTQTSNRIYYDKSMFINLKSKVSLNRIKLLSNIENGYFEFNDNNLLKYASLNKIIETFCSCLYNEDNFDKVILYCIPSISNTIQILQELFYMFFLPIRDSEYSINYKLEQFISTSPRLIQNYIDNSRNNILRFIIKWIHLYWKTDFHGNEEAISKLITFTDFIYHEFPCNKQQIEVLQTILTKYFKESIHQYSEKRIDISLLSPRLSNGSTTTLKEDVSLLSCLDILLNSDINIIAQQLCLIDHRLFRKIINRELLDKLWLSSDCCDELSPNVLYFTNRFNRISQWVATCIIKQIKRKQRIKILEWFITLAQRLYELCNYNSVVAIIGGIQDTSILRLKKTWVNINIKVKQILEDLKKGIMKVDNNWANYTNILTNTLQLNKPCIPYIGLYLRNLIYIEDAIPSIVSVNSIYEVYNIEKLRKVSNILDEINQIQNNSYSFEVIPLINDSLELSISMFMLLDDKERYENSKLIEPISKRKSLPTKGVLV